MSAVGKHIALVGTCPSSRMLAPYGDESIEIWACSPDNAGGVLPRITRFFEVHGDLMFPDHQPWEPSYIEWLNRQSGNGKFELIVQDAKLFPGATRLQFKRLLDLFGSMFFTSTPAWMMAHAIASDVQSIALYGLDMSSRHEYLQQRPAMQHFIAMAIGRGIEVTAPPESDILQPTPLYGFAHSSPYGRKLEVRRKELVARLAGMDATIKQAEHDRIYLQGSLDDIDYHQSVWTGDHDPALVGVERAEPDDRKVVNIKEK